ncbi:MAG: DUF2278 family protein [Archangium sp.]
MMEGVAAFNPQEESAMPQLHQHTGRVLKRPPSPSNRLPKNTYGALVGVLDGPLSDKDNNHVFISVRIRKGNFSGRYQIAFNVESNDPTTQTQYYVYDEAITADEIPPEDFSTSASLSYQSLGLKAADFKPIESGRLRTIVHSTVETSEWISAYGFTYSDGTGLHDVHMNSGEPSGSHHANRPNQDGALACYFRTQDGQEVRRWIFIKFTSQALP